MKVAHLCQTSWNPRGNNNYSKSSHKKGNEKHDIPQITIQHLLKVFLTPISQNKISLFLPWESDKKGNERVNWMVTSAIMANFSEQLQTIYHSEPLTYLDNFIVYISAIPLSWNDEFQELIKFNWSVSINKQKKGKVTLVSWNHIHLFSRVQLIKKNNWEILVTWFVNFYHN